MKKTKLKKQSKQPISKIQRDIWQECRRIADKWYVNNCYTCGAKNLQGANKQLGHMWAKASLGAYMKYDLRVLRWQCMRCNQFLGGMGAEFYKKMLREEGQAYMDKLEQDRQVTVKAYNHYTTLLDYYRSV